MVDQNKLDNWWTEFNDLGGEAYYVDFTDQYTNKFCINNVPKSVLQSIDYIRNMSMEDIQTYANEPDYSIRFNQYNQLERATHILWMIEQDGVIFKPMVTYIEKQKGPRVTFGSARAAAMKMFYDKVPAIYYHLPGNPTNSMLTDESRINSAQEILDYSRNEMWDKALSHEIQDIIIIPTDQIPRDFAYLGKNYPLLNYAFGSFHNNCVNGWTENSVVYKKRIEDNNLTFGKFNFND